LSESKKEVKSGTRVAGSAASGPAPHLLLARQGQGHAVLGAEPDHARKKSGDVPSAKLLQAGGKLYNLARQLGTLFSEARKRYG